MNSNKKLPQIIAIFNYILLQIYFFRPTLVYVAFTLQIIACLFLVRQMLKDSRLENPSRWYNYIIWPFNFSLGLIVFSVLVPSTMLLQALFLVYLLITFYYFKIISRQLEPNPDFDKTSFDNFASYANFMAFYFLASAIYGLQVFLGVNISSLIFAVIIFAVLTIYQVFWVNNINIKNNLHFLLIIVLSLTEIAWSVSFLTLSFYILGLILAVSYYILIGMVRFYINGNLELGLVKRYLIFGLSSILIVLLTTKWISG